MKRDIPWMRVGIEMVVIIASILLAFGIEAWWQRSRLSPPTLIRFPLTPCGG